MSTTHLDKCDKCGKRSELYYNESTGLSYCEECDMASETKLSPIRVYVVEVGKDVKLITSSLELALEEFRNWDDHSGQVDDISQAPRLIADVWENHQV